MQQKLIILLQILEGARQTIREFDPTKLIGDWEELKPGSRIKATFSDPYKVVEGSVFTLPGYTSSNIMCDAIVQYIEPCDDGSINVQWAPLLYLIAACATIEIENG